MPAIPFCTWNWTECLHSALLNRTLLNSQNGPKLPVLIHMSHHVQSRPHWENFLSLSLTPDVWFDGELIVGQRLWGSPLDGELGSLSSIIDVALHEPTQTEIGHLHSEMLINKAVPGSKISGEGTQKRTQSMHPSHIYSHTWCDYCSLTHSLSLQAFLTLFTHTYKGLTFSQQFVQSRAYICM